MYKKSNNTFKIVGISSIIIILILGGLVFLYLKTGFYFSSPKSCEVTPRDPDCFCSEGERKIYVPWIGLPKWSCENIGQLLLDPESPTFESDAITFTQDYLGQYCGSICTDLSCGIMEECVQGNPVYPNDRCIEASYGYNSNGARLANIECNVVTEWDSENRPKSGYSLWQMRFFVESEDNIPNVEEVFLPSNFCYNKQTEEKCTNQKVCDFYMEENGNADWCFGYLPLDVY